MRVGILTFHRAHNYGAVLQCYALVKYLQKQGVDVHVIDYEPSQFVEFYRWYNPAILNMRNPFGIIREYILTKYRKRRYDAFVRFIEENLNLCQKGTEFINPFDVIIVGSDQVWNYSCGVDPYYWGAIKYPECTSLVSYAASMPDKWDDEYSHVISKLLLNFNSISVREASLRDSLIRLTGNSVIEHVVDPTLLLRADDWKEISVKPDIAEPYLLFYYVQYNEKAEQIAMSIAKDKGLELVCLTPTVDVKTSKCVRATSPEEFIGLFEHASFVVSASFHGTVFSLQFNKPFLSFRMNQGRDARVKSLLEPIGLIDHFTDKYNPNMDYSCSYNVEELDKMRTRSYVYIEKTLSKHN